MGAAETLARSDEEIIREMIERVPIIEKRIADWVELLGGKAA